MCNEKSRLRNYFKKIRENIPCELKTEYDESIFNKLLQLDGFLNADGFLLYSSFGSEIDTSKLTEFLISNNRSVAFPKICDDKIMRFYTVSSMSDLVKGKFGIKEPRTDKCELFSFDKDTICIVPGLAFDNFGYRLGYGGGYYDKFLKDYPGYKIGLCYEECKINKLPVDSFDIPADVVVCPQNNYIQQNKL